VATSSSNTPLEKEPISIEDTPISIKIHHPSAPKKISICSSSIPSKTPFNREGYGHKANLPINYDPNAGIAKWKPSKRVPMNNIPKDFQDSEQSMPGSWKETPHKAPLQSNPTNSSNSQPISTNPSNISQDLLRPQTPPSDPHSQFMTDVTPQLDKVRWKKREVLRLKTMHKDTDKCQEAFNKTLRTLNDQEAIEIARIEHEKKMDEIVSQQLNQDAAARQKWEETYRQHQQRSTENQIAMALGKMSEVMQSLSKRIDEWEETGSTRSRSRSRSKRSISRTKNHPERDLRPTVETVEEVSDIE